MNTAVPDWLLERYVLGDLPPERMREVAARLAAEAGADARVAALRASNEEILRRYPPRVVVDRARALQGPTRRPPLALVLVPLAAIAALTALTVLTPPVAPPAAPEQVQIKGLAPALVIHRHRASGDETLPDGAVAAKGDLVQVSYVAAGRKYGAVVSIDGRGAVTRHLPDRGAEAPKLERGGAIALPAAYELDDAPKFERFFFVTADAPFPIAPVLDAARDLAARPDAATADLPLPADLSEASFLLRKETP